MVTVYEFQRQELYDFNVFPTVEKANEYKLQRIKENDDYYESDESRYLFGLNFVIE